MRARVPTEVVTQSNPSSGRRVEKVNDVLEGGQRTNHDQGQQHGTCVARAARGGRGWFGSGINAYFNVSMYCIGVFVCALLFFALRVQTRERRNRQRWIDSGCELGIPRLRR